MKNILLKTPLTLFGLAKFGQKLSIEIACPHQNVSNLNWKALGC